MALAHNLGFPSIGAGRELKRATEGYWGGKVSREQLLRTGAELRAAHWRLQRDAGLDLVPVNDFSFYDRVLDTCALVGAVPGRYGWSSGTVDLDTSFAMARGSQGKGGGGRDVTAMEMTKWFDTNYHYIVPEFEPGQTFHLASTKVADEFQEAKALGLSAKPVLVGPVSFLLLGRRAEPASTGWSCSTGCWRCTRKCWGGWWRPARRGCSSTSRRSCSTARRRSGAPSGPPIACSASGRRDSRSFWPRISTACTTTLIP